MLLAKVFLNVPLGKLLHLCNLKDCGRDKMASLECWASAANLVETVEQNWSLGSKKKKRLCGLSTLIAFCVCGK